MRPHSTGKAMWEYLKKVYSQPKFSRIFQLECEIANYTQGSLSIQDYFYEFQNLWSEFSNIVCATIPKESLINVLAVHKARKCDQFLMKLRSNLKNVHSNLINCHPPSTMDDYFSDLLREEQRLLTQSTLEQEKS